MGWDTVLVGVISGVVASAVWIVLFRRLRPRIEISQVISESSLDGPAGTQSYRIKVLNRSHFDLLDVRLEFMMIELRNVPGGTIDHRIPLTVRPSELIVLPKRPWFTWRDKSKYLDAFRFKLDEDLNAVWQDRMHTSLRIRVSGKHAVSGVGRSFSMSYHDGSAITQGTFKAGRTMDVVPTANWYLGGAHARADDPTTGQGVQSLPEPPTSVGSDA